MADRRPTPDQLAETRRRNLAAIRKAAQTVAQRRLAETGCGQHKLSRAEREALLDQRVAEEAACQHKTGEDRP